MKKSIFAPLLMLAFATYTATAQTADNKTKGNSKTEQIAKRETKTFCAFQKCAWDNTKPCCGKCPNAKPCCGKCPNAKSTSTVSSDNSTTAQSKLDNCPLKGTPDCPLVKNCPKKGTAECPYTNGTASCCAKK